MTQIMIHNTNGKENLERVSLSFVVGNTALTSGQDVTLLLTIEGVRTATQGFADGLQADGFEPLDDLTKSFVDGGGQIWVCGACAKPRNITEEDLIDGAQIVGAVTAVEALVNDARTLNF